ncbi:hypothetical protein FBUS_09100 [Fasciolopsis buskii]|uniref:Uncharacterized protein n=1 Tax=Fasciolopsis buskii TaxID=27845 RepID=A0A8E0RPQ6_9TREM|nr:hypothetical protein FBUS_09100 [Fasciolopsis buski]
MRPKITKTKDYTQKWVEYTINRRPISVQRVLANSDVRTILSRTGCSIDVQSSRTSKHLITRSTNNELAIIRVHVPDKLTLDVLNLELEKAFPAYRFRKQYRHQLPELVDQTNRLMNKFTEELARADQCTEEETSARHFRQNGDDIGSQKRSHISNSKSLKEMKPLPLTNYFFPGLNQHNVGQQSDVTNDPAVTVVTNFSTKCFDVYHEIVYESRPKPTNLDENGNWPSIMSRTHLDYRCPSVESWNTTALSKPESQSVKPDDINDETDYLHTQHFYRSIVYNEYQQPRGETSNLYETHPELTLEVNTAFDHRPSSHGQVGENGVSNVMVVSDYFDTPLIDNGSRNAPSFSNQFLPPGHSEQITLHPHSIQTDTGKTFGETGVLPSTPSRTVVHWEPTMITPPTGQSLVVSIARGPAVETNSSLENREQPSTLSLFLNENSEFTIHQCSVRITEFGYNEDRGVLDVQNSVFYNFEYPGPENADRETAMTMAIQGNEQPTYHTRPTVGYSLLQVENKQVNKTNKPDSEKRVISMVIRSSEFEKPNETVKNKDRFTPGEFGTKFHLDEMDGLELQVPEVADMGPNDNFQKIASGMNKELSLDYNKRNQTGFQASVSTKEAIAQREYSTKFGIGSRTNLTAIQNLARELNSQEGHTQQPKGTVQRTTALERQRQPLLRQSFRKLSSMGTSKSLIFSTSGRATILAESRERMSYQQENKIDEKITDEQDGVENYPDNSSICRSITGASGTKENENQGEPLIKLKIENLQMKNTKDSMKTESLTTKTIYISTKTRIEQKRNETQTKQYSPQRSTRIHIKQNAMLKVPEDLRLLPPIKQDQRQIPTKIPLQTIEMQKESTQTMLKTTDQKTTMEKQTEENQTKANKIEEIPEKYMLRKKRTIPMKTQTKDTPNRSEPDARENDLTNAIMTKTITSPLPTAISTVEQQTELTSAEVQDKRHVESGAKSDRSEEQRKAASQIRPDMQSTPTLESAKSGQIDGLAEPIELPVPTEMSTVEHKPELIGAEVQDKRHVESGAKSDRPEEQRKAASQIRPDMQSTPTLESAKSGQIDGLAEVSARQPSTVPSTAEHKPELIGAEVQDKRHVKSGAKSDRPEKQRKSGCQVCPDLLSPRLNELRKSGKLVGCSGLSCGLFDRVASFSNGVPDAQNLRPSPVFSPVEESSPVADVSVLSLPSVLVPLRLRSTSSPEPSSFSSPLPIEFHAATVEDQSCTTIGNLDVGTDFGQSDVLTEDPTSSLAQSSSVIEKRDIEKHLHDLLPLLKPTKDNDQISPAITPTHTPRISLRLIRDAGQSPILFGHENELSSRNSYRQRALDSELVTSTSPNSPILSVTVADTDVTMGVNPLSDIENTDRNYATIFSHQPASYVASVERRASDIRTTEPSKQTQRLGVSTAVPDAVMQKPLTPSTIHSQPSTDGRLMRGRHSIREQRQESLLHYSHGSGGNRDLDARRAELGAERAGHLSLLGPISKNSELHFPIPDSHSREHRFSLRSAGETLPLSDREISDQDVAGCATCQLSESKGSESGAHCTQRWPHLLTMPSTTLTLTDLSHTDKMNDVKTPVNSPPHATSLVPRETVAKSAESETVPMDEVNISTNPVDIRFPGPTKRPSFGQEKNVEDTNPKELSLAAANMFQPDKATLSRQPLFNLTRINNLGESADDQFSDLRDDVKQGIAHFLEQPSTKSAPATNVDYTKSSAWNKLTDVATVHADRQPSVYDSIYEPLHSVRENQKQIPHAASSITVPVHEHQVSSMTSNKIPHASMGLASHSLHPQSSVDPNSVNFDYMRKLPSVGLSEKPDSSKTVTVQPDDGTGPPAQQALSFNRPPPAENDPAIGHDISSHDNLLIRTAMYCSFLIGVSDQDTTISQMQFSTISKSPGIEKSRLPTKETAPSTIGIPCFVVMDALAEIADPMDVPDYQVAHMEQSPTSNLARPTSAETALHLIDQKGHVVLNGTYIPYKSDACWNQLGKRIIIVDKPRAFLSNSRPLSVLQTAPSIFGGRDLGFDYPPLRSLPINEQDQGGKRIPSIMDKMDTEGKTFPGQPNSVENRTLARYREDSHPTHQVPDFIPSHAGPAGASGVSPAEMQRQSTLGCFVASPHKCSCHRAAPITDNNMITFAIKRPTTLLGILQTEQQIHQPNLQPQTIINTSCHCCQSRLCCNTTSYTKCSRVCGCTNCVTYPVCYPPVSRSNICHSYCPCKCHPVPKKTCIYHSNRSNQVMTNTLGPGCSKLCNDQLNTLNRRTEDSCIRNRADESQSYWCRASRFRECNKLSDPWKGATNPVYRRCPCHSTQACHSLAKSTQSSSCPSGLGWRKSMLRENNYQSGFGNTNSASDTVDSTRMIPPISSSFSLPAVRGTSKSVKKYNKLVSSAYKSHPRRLTSKSTRRALEDAKVTRRIVKESSQAFCRKKAKEKQSDNF